MLLWDYLMRASGAVILLVLVSLALVGVIYGTVLALRAVLGS